jgi:hydroxyethylthiazole kinase-like sugar kinase family protein
MIVAGQSANLNKKPIIFDPVAVGATAYRQETAKRESSAFTLQAKQRIK